MNQLTQCEYRVVQFIDADPHRDGVPKYVGVAWNYAVAVLMSTTPHNSYTGARAELDKLAHERGCSLRWFDGEYVCEGKLDGTMVKAPHDTRHDAEEQASHAGEDFSEHYG